MAEIINKQIERIERSGLGYKNEIDWGDSISENFEEEHKKHKLAIKEILESYPKATNNDFILYIEFLNLMNMIKITESKDRKEVIIRIEKSKVPFITVPESVRRARQSLNAQGIGLATNLEVLEMRKSRSKAIRNYFAREKYENKVRFIKWII